MKKKKVLYITFSFLIPFLIYTIIFFVNGLLTHKNIISGDMYVQYYPLFNYLKGIFNGANSIFYTFSKGLGGTMFGTIFYYLSSPLNIFLVFVNKQHIPDFMTYLIIIKLSLCGLTMYVYMRKKFKTDNLLLLVFSLCYAFMGYNLNYFVNIMWLDVVIMAPLVLLGLEKIIEDKSPKIYIITLFISIFSNYYISYMLCIFCVLYFIYELLIKYDLKNDKEKIIKIIKKFVISSLLAGGLCAAFLIPCIYEMLDYGRKAEINKILTFDYNFFDLFSKTYIGSLDLKDTLNYTSMNLYCSIIIIPLVYLFIVNRRINKKERILTLLIIMMMIIPCFIGPLNYVWHLFTIPSFYSYRYSFLLCLFLIRIAYKSIKELNITNFKILFYLSIYLIISLLLIIITFYGKYYEFLNYKLIWVTITFLIIYIILLKINQKKSINKIIVLLILIENILNITLIFKNNDFHERKIFRIEKIYQEKIKDYKDNGRMDSYNQVFTMNNSMLFDYKGVNNFLSTINYKQLDFLIKVGKNKKTTSYNYYNMNGQSYITNSLLGMNTTIELKDNYGYKHIESFQMEVENELNIYQNENVLSLGYMIKNECNNIDFSFPYDEKIFNCITGEEKEYYSEVKKEKNHKYKLEKKGTYYIYIGKNDIEKTKINVNQEQLNNVETTYIQFDNKIENYMLEIEFEDEIKEEPKVLYFKKDYFNRKLKNINEQLEYKIEKGKLEGKINNKEGILMITIPYENGIEVYVDGKKTKKIKVLDTFIGIRLNEGIHEIKVQYQQPGLKLGIGISALFLLGTIVYIKKDKKRLY